MRLLSSIKKLVRNIFMPMTLFEVPFTESAADILAARVEMKPEPVVLPKPVVLEGEGEVKVEPNGQEVVSLVLSRKAVKDWKIHYVDDNLETHTLCGSKIFRTDTILPLIKDGEVRKIDCITCQSIVDERNKRGLVKIARVKPKKEQNLKRGRPVKDKSSIDDGIISIKRHDDMQQLPFSIRPHTTPIIPAAASLVTLFSTTSYDFGTVIAGDEPVYEFKIVNPFNEEVRISSVSSMPRYEVWLYGCGVSTGPLNYHKLSCSHVIAPHSETKLFVKVKSHFIGGGKATITVEFERPSKRHVELTISSYVTKRFAQREVRMPWDVEI
jgi:hypothetical protein